VELEPDILTVIFFILGPAALESWNSGGRNKFKGSPGWQLQAARHINHPKIVFCLFYHLSKVEDDVLCHNNNLIFPLYTLTRQSISNPSLSCCHMSISDFMEIKQLRCTQHLIMNNPPTTCSHWFSPQLYFTLQKSAFSSKCYS
jgi:hypothetical protein